MCFTAGADLAVGLALVPVGVAALRGVRRPAEIPFASLPLVLAAHQLTEAVVWLGTTGDVGPRVASAAALAYVLVALSLLPVLVPVSVLLLLPVDRRQMLAPFALLGALVATYFVVVLASRSVTVTPHAYGLEYGTGVEHGWLWAALYIAAVIGPPLLSGERTLVAFGVANLVGLTVVAALALEAFISLWCAYAALTSVLVLVHVRRRPEGIRAGRRPAQEEA